jgi:hypothetical protein
MLKKFKCLVIGRWVPDINDIMREAHKALVEDVFGDEEDFGDHLLKISVKHHEREWTTEHISDSHRTKAYAISALAVSTNNRLKLLDSYPTLRLKLWLNANDICELAYLMAVKIPIISVKWFLNIHVEYAFNEIRKSTIELKNDIVDYLYDLLFLQQKTILAISDYLLLASSVVENKKASASLMNAEMDTMMRADLAFTYLKASVEKVVSLLGAIHGIADLSSKKSHKDRLRALNEKIPDALKKTEYFLFIWEAISAENLDELNSYRTGLLHKKGIADIQPHNYVGFAVDDLPFLKIFSVLHHQHAVNTVLLIAVLAMLTDELVRLDPEFQHDDPFVIWLTDELMNLYSERYFKHDENDRVKDNDVLKNQDGNSSHHEK